MALAVILTSVWVHQVYPGSIRRSIVHGNWLKSGPDGRSSPRRLGATRVAPFDNFTERARRESLFQPRTATNAIYIDSCTREKVMYPSKIFTRPRRCSARSPASRLLRRPFGTFARRAAVTTVKVWPCKSRPSLPASLDTILRIDNPCPSRRQSFCPAVTLPPTARYFVTPM